MSTRMDYFDKMPDLDMDPFYRVKAAKLEAGETEMLCAPPPPNFDWPMCLAPPPPDIGWVIDDKEQNAG